MHTVLRTDVGRIRTINEDRAAVASDLSGVTLSLLADGMGGHQAGDVASQTAIDVLTRELRGLHSDLSSREWETAIHRAFERANAEIYAQASMHAQLSGMGTTGVVALSDHSRLTIAHIGDSRAYLVHKGKLMQLTEDHSLVNELLKSGQITDKEASTHPRRNVLTRALGTDIDIAVDIRHMEWESGDQLLLCSDGLTNMVNDKAILHTLTSNKNMEWKADRLIKLALDGGGDDNVTVVLVKHETPSSERRES
jgi:serine/threonine protein phosphatase PrpC